MSGRVSNTGLRSNMIAGVCGSPATTGWLASPISTRSSDPEQKNWLERRPATTFVTAG